MSPATFERFAALVHRQSGLVLGPDKLYLVVARLAPVVARAGAGDVDRLAEQACAAPHGALAAEAVQAMTTNETMFFRDGHPFEDLARRLPALAAARPEGVPLRIWSAAASSGQEAYSIGIVATELRPLLGGRRVEILGTDLSRAALDRAIEGVYSDFEVQRGLSAGRRGTHLRREGSQAGGQWRVVPPLRDMVQFRPANLLGDLRGLGRFDVVFCRNVLIYFDRDTKTQALQGIVRQLAPDGVLYLGGTETLLGLDVALRRASLGNGFVHADHRVELPVALAGAGTPAARSSALAAG